MAMSVNLSVSEMKKKKKKKKNLLTTTMQYTLAKENHITVVVGCRKGQRHQCRNVSSGTLNSTIPYRQSKIANFSHPTEYFKIAWAQKLE